VGYDRITDRYSEDTKIFKENYPLLENYEIKKNIAVLIKAKS